MKLLGIDFGKKKIGLAYSEGFLPSPLQVIPVTSEKQILAEVIALIRRMGIEKIVIGLSGGIHDEATKKFGDAIAAQTQLPITYIDETLTSKTAVSKMIEGGTTQKKRRTQEDAIAATLILDIYLQENPSLEISN